MTGRELSAEEKVRTTRGRVHSQELYERESVKVCGVTDVEAFNEEEIVMLTEMGTLVVAGEGMHIVKLDLDEGVLLAEGHILAAEYLQEGHAAKKSVWAGLFK